MSEIMEEKVGETENGKGHFYVSVPGGKRVIDLGRRYRKRNLELFTS